MSAMRLLVTVVLAAATFQPADDAARVAFRARLKQAQRLSGEEMTRLFEEIGRATTGKVLRARRGALTMELDQKQRAEVFGMLADPSAVYDGGARVEAGVTMRALSAGGTPPNSEVEATQRLWIDGETFLPRRYELAFALPGLGDYSYDLVVTP
jgi:uncharacterized tellurite resistance protein B-like protein